MEMILNIVFAFILIAYSFGEELLLVALEYVDKDNDTPIMKITKCVILSLVSTIIFFALYVFMLGNPITNILVWSTIGFFVFNALLNYTYLFLQNLSWLELCFHFKVKYEDTL